MLKVVLPSSALPTFILLLELSGMLSSTFPLLFAYISNTVRQQEERVAAYGFALGLVSQLDQLWETITTSQ